MRLLESLKWTLRTLVYPGLDLHLRSRAALCRFWKVGARDVLDAGSGNGYFSWLAYRTGACVVAMNFEQGQVDRATSYFLGYRQADPLRLRFERRNLYELTVETRAFDEIICYETLEHIRDDELVARQFFRLLKPGGNLHLCCPNRLHPRNRAEVLDRAESGGHVRAGYSLADYRALLEPLGFRVAIVAGVGPRSVYLADAILRYVRNRFGDWLALPLLPIGMAIVSIARLDPPTPFSLYVRAEKPGP